MRSGWKSGDRPSVYWCWCNNRWYDDDDDSSKARNGKRVSTAGTTTTKINISLRILQQLLPLFSFFFVCVSVCVVSISTSSSCHLTYERFAARTTCRQTMKDGLLYYFLYIADTDTHSHTFELRNMDKSERVFMLLSAATSCWCSFLATRLLMWVRALLDFLSVVSSPLLYLIYIYFFMSVDINIYIQIPLLFLLRSKRPPLMASFFFLRFILKLLLHYFYIIYFSLFIFRFKGLRFDDFLFWFLVSFHSLYTCSRSSAPCLEF